MPFARAAEPGGDQTAFGFGDGRCVALGEGRFNENEFALQDTALLVSFDNDRQQNGQNNKKVSGYIIFFRDIRSTDIFLSFFILSRLEYVFRLTVIYKQDMPESNLDSLKTR